MLYRHSEYCFSSSLSQFICTITLHNLLVSKLLPLQISPHSQFDDHRRFSAYPSLTFPAVLLIALFIKHSSNSFLRGFIRILLSLQSQKTLYNISTYCFGLECFRRKACGRLQVSALPPKFSFTLSASPKFTTKLVSNWVTEDFIFISVSFIFLHLCCLYVELNNN